MIRGQEGYLIGHMGQPYTLKNNGSKVGFSFAIEEPFRKQFLKEPYFLIEEHFKNLNLNLFCGMERSHGC